MVTENVQIYTLFLIPYFTSVIIPKFGWVITITVILLSLQGLVGYYWNWMNTEFTIGYSAFALGFLMIVWHYIEKRLVYGEYKTVEAVYQGDMDQNAALVGALQNDKFIAFKTSRHVKTLFKPITIKKWAQHIPMLIWTISHISVAIANYVFLHWFTTFSDKWFGIYYGGVLIPSIAVAVGLVNFAVVWFEVRKRGKETTIAEKRDVWINFTHFWAQYWLMNCVIIFSYFVFEKICGWHQVLAMLAGLGLVYIPIEIGVIVVIKIVQAGWLGNKVQKGKVRLLGKIGPKSDELEMGEHQPVTPAQFV